MKLFFAAVIFTMVALGGVCYAHDGDNRYRVGRYSYVDARQHGYNYGYQDGYRHGREDRFRRFGFDYQSRSFKKAEHGYEKFMGSKGEYKHGYRDGYVTGYEAGYYGRSAFTSPPDRYEDRYGTPRGPRWPQ